MNNVFILFLGVVLVTVLIPVLNFIGECVEILLEVIRSKASVYVNHNNIEIAKQNSLIESNATAIGFEIPSDEIELEDSQDKKVGF